MTQPQNLIRILHSGTLPSRECCKPTQINPLMRREKMRIGDGDKIRSKDRQKPKTKTERQLSCLTHIDVVGSSLHPVKVIPDSGGVYESED